MQTQEIFARVGSGAKADRMRASLAKNRLLAVLILALTIIVAYLVPSASNAIFFTILPILALQTFATRKCRNLVRSQLSARATACGIAGWRQHARGLQHDEQCLDGRECARNRRMAVVDDRIVYRRVRGGNATNDVVV